VKEYLRDSDKLIEQNCTAWLLELWKLFKADVLASVNAVAEALETARRVVDFHALGPRAPHYIGAYCRWCARIANGRAERQSAQNFIGRLAQELPAHDALDQAEILLALLMSGQEHLEGTVVRELLHQHLTRLPRGVAAHFQRVGMLS
jgi:hypothetical protein